MYIKQEQVKREMTLFVSSIEQRKLFSEIPMLEISMTAYQGIGAVW